MKKIKKNIPEELKKEVEQNATEESYRARGSGPGFGRGYGYRDPTAPEPDSADGDQKHPEVDDRMEISDVEPSRSAERNAEEDWPNFG